MARFTASCPFTSAKSQSKTCELRAKSSRVFTTVGCGASGSSFSNASVSERERTPMTSRSLTTAASTALSAGTMRRRSPMERASMAIGSAPFTGSTEPSSESSPVTMVPASDSSVTTPAQERTPRAIGRSNEAPSLRTSAGERFMTMRWWGYWQPLLRIAATMRV